MTQGRHEDVAALVNGHGHATGSETLARRKHGDEAQEDSRERRGDRDDDDERREGERMHAGHDSPAVHQVHDRVVQRARTRLAGHAVRLAAHVGLTRQRGEEQVAAHLREGAERDERPRRRTQLGCRSEDECRRSYKDRRDDDRGSASARQVTGQRKSRSQHAQGGSGDGARHGDSVAPRPWASGVHT